MPDLRTRYCLGFALSPTHDQVLLLRKNRPAFLAGKWTGAGGHVEVGESPLETMVREFAEEAQGSTTATQWVPLAHRENHEWTLEVFGITTDLSVLRALTDEPLQRFDLTALPDALGPGVREDLAAAQRVLQRSRIGRTWWR